MSGALDTLLETLSTELTEPQRKAGDWSEGAILILAGPGSGKTRVLAYRVAKLLRDSAAKQFRVLGLTFTNKGAEEMRQRVERLVPDQVNRVFLGTFHSFSANVLRNHGNHLGIKPDFHIFNNEDDLKAVLSSASSPDDVVLLPVIRRLKQRLISPSEAPNVLRSEELKTRIQPVYEAYEKGLREQNALDFESLIYYTCELLRQFPAFARRYQTVYPFWCIDEFQDTNLAQYLLIKSMAQPSFRNLFVVADDDQIIYQWNGASHQRISEFIKDFDPELLQLPDNFRCPEPVVVIANNLIRNNLARTPGKLPAKAHRSLATAQKDVIRLLEFRNETDECQGVADDIRERSPASWADVMVLARNRKLLEAVREALKHKEIPAYLHTARDQFLSPAYIWLHACLCQANRRSDERNLKLLMGAFDRLTGISMPPEDVISNAEGQASDLLQEWVNETKTDSEDIKTIISAVKSHLVSNVDYKMFANAALTWFDRLEKTGILADTDEEFSSYKEDKVAWQSLWAGIHNSAEILSLKDFLQELSLRTKEPPPPKNAVTLLTIHAAKGKESRHVYLIGLAEDILPSFQSKKQGATSMEMEEERRNCYVAITRTTETLTLSHAQTYKGWDKERSRFVKEMGL